MPALTRIYCFPDQNLLVSDPASHRYSSPAHSTDKAARQTFPAGAVVGLSIRIVHGDWLCAGKGLLSAVAHVVIKTPHATHHGGGSGVGIGWVWVEVL